MGVFVLGHLFHEAWRWEAPKMQAEFNDCLEVFHTQCSFCQEYHVLIFVFDVHVFAVILGNSRDGCGNY